MGSIGATGKPADIQYVVYLKGSESLSCNFSSSLMFDSDALPFPDFVNTVLRINGKYNILARTCPCLSVTVNTRC